MHIDRYERRWIQLSAVLLVVFAVAIAFSAGILGIELPGIEDQVLPTATAGEHDLAQGWVRELAPGHYEVNMRARVWAFSPNEIRVPQGSTVTFYVHSDDIIHGLKILNTTVSLMVIPGQMARTTYTFSEPDDYLFVCHEYCGAGHHFMSGRIIVEEL